MEDLQKECQQLKDKLENAEIAYMACLANKENRHRRELQSIYDIIKEDKSELAQKIKEIIDASSTIVQKD